MTSDTTIALIVAAGRGSRLATGTKSKAADPKQYRMLGNECVLQHTISVFARHEKIDKILVVIHKDDHALYQRLIAPHKKLLNPVNGGDTRQESVLLGLAALAEATSPTKVLIHDAARPFVEPETISTIIKNISPGVGAAPGAPVSDTMKRVDHSNTVINTVPREHLFAIQTPQGFMFNEIHKAHSACSGQRSSVYTDDASLFESLEFPVKLINSSSSNFKITTQHDMARAQMITKSNRVDVRTASGYDVHAFEPGKSVWLCGVEIPHNKKLKGHSDADAPLHALTDAILGTIGAGDIGTYFPPDDPQWKNAKSHIFLNKALSMIADKGGKLNNIDVTIICEMPKIGPHRENMQNQLATLCGLEHERVGVKATTNEKLGFLGREEGIAAIASATVSFGAKPHEY